MRANLNGINAARRLRKVKRVERVTQVILRLPRAFQASQSKGLMAQALTSLGLDPNPARLKRLRVYAIRYGLMTYDRARRLWKRAIDLPR